MPFIVEDGTGIPNANSYTSVEFADEYFTLRNEPKWLALTTEQKQAALVKATDYIDMLPLVWVGLPFTLTQSLKFPRLVMGVPVPLQKACVLYALRSVTGKLAPDPVVDNSGVRVVSSTKKVGSLEKSVTYASPSSDRSSNVQLFRDYPEADALLAAFVRRRSANGRVIR